MVLPYDKTVGNRRDRDRMIAGVTTTYAIKASCEFASRMTRCIRYIVM